MRESNGEGRVGHEGVRGARQLACGHETCPPRNNHLYQPSLPASQPASQSMPVRAAHYRTDLEAVRHLGVVQE